jgi:hypothetical protein
MTQSSTDSSLVERLLKGVVRYHTYAGPVYAGPTAVEREAADRISTLERELEEAMATARSALQSTPTSDRS